MIDLETIAETRAKDLEQPEKEWVEALRQPSFNDFSGYLSDGEIEKFVLSFESPEALTRTSGMFLKGYFEGNESAFMDFCAVIEGSQMTFDKALDFLCQLEVLQAHQGQNWLFVQKLEALQKFIESGAEYSKGMDISNFTPSSAS